MNSKIQELTDAIYNEGVAKGQAQADRIVEQANSKASDMIQAAKRQADEILASARLQSETEAQNVRKELKLYCNQAIASLKSEICNLVTGKIAAGAASGLLSDQNTFNSLVLEIARQWNGSQAPVITAAQADGLKAFFTAQAGQLLDGGLEIKPAHGAATSFTIQPKDGSYKVNFGEAEFESWIKSMLREQIQELLFN